MIYASDPTHVVDIARIPPEVFSAFKLPPPPLIQQGQQPAGRRSRPVAPVPVTTPAASDAATRQVAAFRQQVDAWVQEGTPLEQGIAREVRAAISTALKHRIDWNRERCRQAAILPSQISIPNARGEAGIAADSFPIAADSKDPDGRLRNALVALYRFHDVYKQRADYDEADDDLARIGNFLDGLLPAALQLVRTTANRDAKTYTSLLAANSRILGIPERGRSAGAVSSFLFAPAPDIEKVRGDWPLSFPESRALQEDARALRPQLTQLLLESAGCFQGRGHTSDGTIITRIAECFAAGESPEGSATGSVPTEVKQKLAPMSDQRVQVRARRVTADATRLQAEVLSSLGGDFDKNAACDAMKELAAELKEHGSWESADIGMSFAEFKELCESFRTTPIKDVLNQLERLAVSDASNVVPIAAVAQLPFQPLLTAQRFITAASRLVRSTDKIAATLESQFRGVNRNVLANDLLREFDRTIEQLTDISKSGEA